MNNPAQNWQKTLWRAWWHTPDRELAEPLFAAVADEPAGRGFTLSLLLLGALYGAVAGLGVGMIAANLGLAYEEWTLAGPPLAPFVAGGVGLGILGTGLLRWSAGKQLTWRTWIRWLMPSVLPGELRGAVVAVLVTGLIVGLALGLSFSSPKLVEGPGSGWEVGLAMGLVVVLVVGLLVGLGGVLVDGLGGFLSGGLGIVLLLVWGGPEGRLLGLILMGILVGGFVFGLVGGMTGLLKGDRYAWEYRNWLWWWQEGRPHAFVLEQALDEASAQRPAVQKQWEQPRRRLEAARARRPPVEELVRILRTAAWADRFVAGHALVSRGGEAAAALRPLLADHEAGSLPGLAAHLIRDVAADTTERLEATAPRLLCARCLVRCHAHSVGLSWSDRVTYYGCRTCHQSEEWVDWPGEVVAVLDRDLGPERVEQNETLRVNWLKHKAVFDFDRVEVVNVTDEETERFCIQVGNDRDEWRQGRYRELPCVVRCPLEEDTQRILRDKFQVKREEA